MNVDKFVVWNVSTKGYAKLGSCLKEFTSDLKEAEIWNSSMAAIKCMENICLEDDNCPLFPLSLEAAQHQQ